MSSKNVWSQKKMQQIIKKRGLLVSGYGSTLDLPLSLNKIKLILRLVPGAGWRPFL